MKTNTTLAVYVVIILLSFVVSFVTL